MDVSDFSIADAFRAHSDLLFPVQEEGCLRTANFITMEAVHNWNSSMVGSIAPEARHINFTLFAVIWQCSRRLSPVISLIIAPNQGIWLLTLFVGVGLPLLKHV